MATDFAPESAIAGPVAAAGFAGLVAGGAYLNVGT